MPRQLQLPLSSYEAFLQELEEELPQYDLHNYAELALYIEETGRKYGFKLDDEEVDQLASQYFMFPKALGEELEDPYPPSYFTLGATPMRNRHRDPRFYWNDSCRPEDWQR